MFTLFSDIVKGLFDNDISLAAELPSDLFDEQITSITPLQVKQEELSPTKVDDDLSVEENFDIVNFAAGSGLTNDTGQSVTFTAVQQLEQVTPENNDVENTAVQPTHLQLAQLLQMQNDSQQQIEALKQRLKETEMKREQQMIGSRQIQLHSQLVQHLAKASAANAQQQQKSTNSQPQQLKFQLTQQSAKPVVPQLKQTQVQSTPLKIQIAASASDLKPNLPQTAPAHIIVQHVTSANQMNTQPQQIIIQPQPTIQTNVGQVTVQQLHQVG